MELGVLVQQFGRQHVLDDQLHHAFAQVGVLHVRVVLGGQHDGVDADHAAVFITAGDLGLGVRAQPGQQARLAGFGLALHQTVGEADRRRHQHVGFVAGIAEHQALVAGALIFGLGAVDTLVDVGGLLANDVEDAAGGAIETDVGAVVADVDDDLAHQLFQVDPGGGGDFTGDDGDTGLDQGFAGDAGVLVLGNDGVEDGIGDLVGNLVRMAFGHGFGGKQGVFAHLSVFLLVTGG
ncbi:hypothetical protein D3C78_747170 [compost metagenome]